MRSLAARIAMLVTTISGLGAAACGTGGGAATNAANAERVGTVASAVQGGELAPSHSFAVMIEKSNGRLCSATLIAPNLVLTARHCVSLEPVANPDGCEAFPPAKPEQLTVSTLTDPFGQDAPKLESNQVRAKRIVPGPAVDGCTPDLAILELASNLDALVATPSFDEGLALPAAFREKVSVVGYGLDDDGYAGARRVRADVDVICVDGDDRFACDPNGISTFMQPFQFVTGPGPCRGDSGGGIYDRERLAEGRAVVVGVVNAGYDKDGICQEGLNVRVDRFRDFIAQQGGIAARNGGYPLPSWAIAPPPEEPAEAEEAEQATSSEPLEPTRTTRSTSGCSAGPTIPDPWVSSVSATLLLVLTPWLRRRTSGAWLRKSRGLC